MQYIISVLSVIVVCSQPSEAYLNYTRCLSSNPISCLADKVATVIEKSLDKDITLFDGVKLLRHNGKLKEKEKSQKRSQQWGWSRLTSAASDLLDTHRFALDLTEEDKEEGRKGGGGGGGGGGSGDGGGGGFGFGFDKKQLKKEGKYAQYAFMVLLGIFGMTGPLVMKTLAVMAAKALIASKMALIIVGSIALKKIFEKDHDKTSVKVHTVAGDGDHDRIFVVRPASASWPHWVYEPQGQVKST